MQHTGLACSGLADNEQFEEEVCSSEGEGRIGEGRIGEGRETVKAREGEGGEQVSESIQMNATVVFHGNKERKRRITNKMLLVEEKNVLTRLAISLIIILPVSLIHSGSPSNQLNQPTHSTPFEHPWNKRRKREWEWPATMSLLFKP